MLSLEGRLFFIMKGKKMMENRKSITIELYPKIAPNTVNNFISLIKKKFFDGLSFHRVIADFMIQGGCPEGTGAGGPGYRIKGEFLSNNFKNDLKHEKGVISMARSSEPDSAGSQFFIMHRYTQHLDGNYAAFGKVIEGMDEFNRIINVKKDRNDKPIIPETIKEITVDCFGEGYPEPTVIVG
jgi:peptidyl-prolyl cis-trans isomerase B (cyclophilin B)